MVAVAEVATTAGLVAGFSATGFGVFAGSTILGFASFACAGGVGRATGGVATGLEVAGTLGDAVSAVLTLTLSRSTAADDDDAAGEFVTAVVAVDEVVVVTLGLTGSLTGAAVVTAGATEGQRCPWY